MPHSSTDPAEDPPDLPPVQLRALASLARGSSVTDAAGAAEVDRTTLHRWLREDTAFQAAWNSLRRDILAEIEGSRDPVGQNRRDFPVDARSGVQGPAPLSLFGRHAVQDPGSVDALQR